MYDEIGTNFRDIQYRPVDGIGPASDGITHVVRRILSFPPYPDPCGCTAMGIPPSQCTGGSKRSRPRNPKMVLRFDRPLPPLTKRVPYEVWDWDDDEGDEW